MNTDTENTTNPEVGAEAPEPAGSVVAEVPPGDDGQAAVETAKKSGKRKRNGPVDKKARAAVAAIGKVLDTMKLESAGMAAMAELHECLDDCEES